MEEEDTTSLSLTQYSPPPPSQTLSIVLETILYHLPSPRDLNTCSLVCRSWYLTDSYTRHHLTIPNVYSVSPARVSLRFPNLRSVSLKGRPRFSDFGLMCPEWGAGVGVWVGMFTARYPWLERIWLKRMTAGDHDLEALAKGFKGLRELTLVCCDGFGTAGLAVVVATCRQLRVLDLIEDELNAEDDDEVVDWISCFPECGTCLESLSFECVEQQVNFNALERLVSRSPNLKKLRLNQHVSIEELYRLMFRAPQLTHLGTGSFSSAQNLVGFPGEGEPDYRAAFVACRLLECLSGFRDVLPRYLPVIYPVCGNLTSLNLSYANLNAQELKSIICQCHKLQTLLVLDTVRDEGLEAVGATCKDLVELRVFPIDAREDSEGFVSELGLLAIAEGCRKLRSILYFCQRMTNAVVITMSKNCPELVVFRLCIMGRLRPDHVTNEPMDEGFGAIVMNCKKLTRLAVSGLLTDKAFAYIGKYGKLVRTLSVAFAGDSDMALKFVLEGCSNLQKLEIRDSPFGDFGLLAGLSHYYNMRFFWMSSCRITLQTCTHIVRTLPKMVVEVFTNDTVGVEDDDEFVDTVYMYRSLAGPRNDAPSYVRIV
ncbi:Transport inhibitor response 1-like protein [Drosera capensis]